ncbi:hypothetical protein AVEN_140311-1 [Araneus ventricosus]|uniref:Uncharacterized protein n=1 Tax=Araneus ventricosus TaxID=182803 RepID=A0A4Y2FG27_ARAVE|nr:hypothetical protein AVEN_140311-1 [Araneus ventricosus]
MARKFIGLHESDFGDSVRSVIYDSDGQKFYEERQGRSLNQGVQQPNAPDLLENMENSDIEIDNSDAEPDYVPTEDGSDSDTIDYDYLHEININNHPPSLTLSSPPAPVSAHAECSNNGLPDQTCSSKAGFGKVREMMKTTLITFYQIVSLKIG